MLRKIIKIIIILFIFLGLIYWYADRKMQGSESNSPVEQKFTIISGEGVNQISERLEKRGLISNNVYFDIYIWKSGREGKIITGTYILRPNMTIPEIVDTITSGKAEPQDIKITIIEGWSNKQIGEYLAQKNIISEKDWQEEIENIDKYQAEYSFLEDLATTKNTLEGFLFPDTYLLHPETTAEMIIIKMLNNFNQKVTDTVKEDIAKNGHSLRDIIIMASIVEKEAPKKNDQKIIAGIFWKRLSDNYPLQSCATINYILGTSKEKLSLADTRINSPYNTYVNKGLPPSPIANPGINAIMAATYPQESDYFYFLNDPETGEIIFARTLDEHARNKEEHSL
ncbi:MAG: endolytic transglycosylase MltG [Patescibacteria group bacterium]|nr:endolytic transglycosylase MltG [Patescibacteria group bacterium]